MTGDVINLRRARKAKARVEQDKKSAENRAYFGRSKAEKQRTEQTREKIKRELDQARIVHTPGDEGVSS